MNHKVNALLVFLAAEHSSSKEEMNKLLSDSNIERAAKAEGMNPEQFCESIYKTFTTLGFESAKGEFGVTVVS